MAVVATTAQREEGTAVKMAGSDKVMNPERPAMAREEGSAGEPWSAMKIASCDLIRRQPSPLRKPFMILSVTSDTARDSLVATTSITSAAASITAGAMYTTPCCAMRGASGTATTPAAPAIKAGDAPRVLMNKPAMTEDQMPTSGGTPAMLAKAIDVGTEANATTTPLRTSLTALVWSPTADGWSSEALERVIDAETRLAASLDVAPRALALVPHVWSHSTDIRRATARGACPLALPSASLPAGAPGGANTNAVACLHARVRWAVQ